VFEVWTEDYFGNGFGQVESGPFSGFSTPIGPLIRNIGSDGSLIPKYNQQNSEQKRTQGRKNLFLEYSSVHPPKHELVNVEIPFVYYLGADFLRYQKRRQWMATVWNLNIHKFMFGWMDR
jgi:hypothetical protein